MATTSNTSDGLKRLIERQEEEIKSISKTIELWNTYKDDYTKLKQLIDELQNKVRHPHKIPIAGSQLAFVKGHIVHTNEITVLLGDNYFALRSSRQATEIVDRRLVNIEDTLKKNIDSKKKIEDWLKVSRERLQEKEEFVEIIETM